MLDSGGDPVQPVAEPIIYNERLVTLDVLRGFAIFGIMFINVHALVNPVDWFKVNWHQLPTIEYAAEIFKLLFIQGKFYTLFAILFGIGFVMQLRRAQLKGHEFGLRFLWRMILLWLIGVFHIVFIWYGDILSTYAIAGVLLLVGYLLKVGIYRCLPSLQVATHHLTGYMILGSAIALIVIPFLFQGTHLYKQMQMVRTYQSGELLTLSKQQIMDKVSIAHNEQRLTKKDEQSHQTQAIYEDGTYAQVVAMRIDQLADRFKPNSFWLTLCGMFLLGVFLGRGDYIGKACLYRSHFVYIGLLAFIFGMAFNLIFVYFSIYSPKHSGEYWSWITFVTKTFAGLGITTAFIAVISLGVLGPAKKYWMVFAPVGRMALSHYLLQSIVGTSLIYGYGLDLVGRLNVFEQTTYILTLFAVQWLISCWWLSRYQFGPVEWLWRSLTYMAWQPMRIKNFENNPASVVS